MHNEGFSYLTPNVHGRIQRSHWILEDHTDLISSNVFAIYGFLTQDIDASQMRLSAGDAPRRHWDQTHDALYSHGFTTTRLTDNRECFAGIDLE